MIKRLAVLLLKVGEAAEVPSKAYAEQLFTAAGRNTRNLVDFYADMSHGRLDIGMSQVFDWIPYGHTQQDLVDDTQTAVAAYKSALLASGVNDVDATKLAGESYNSYFRSKTVEWANTAASAAGYALTGFDVLVCLFNAPIDYWGNTGTVVLNWNAEDPSTFSVDLTGVAHEVGHGLGLMHSRMEGSDDEYGDPWDIMSGYDSVMLTESKQVTAGNPYYTYGPGLNAANMDLLGWLDPLRLLTADDTRGFSFRLRPLHRRDLPGYLAAKLTIGSDSLYVEYRAAERWDASIPEACVLLHRRGVHPASGTPCSYLVIARPDLDVPRAQLLDGESYRSGDPTDVFGRYFSLKVDIDDTGLQATINVQVRHRRRFESTEITFGGVDAGGGGLVWVPGRGVVRIPPDSPLRRVVELVAEHETVQQLERASGPQIASLSLDHLIEMRDQIDSIVTARRTGYVPAPLHQRTDVRRPSAN